jgi:phosphatidylglycerophosphate synthase
MSLFERMCLNRLWDRCAASYPLWLAPNLITLAGFMCLMIGMVWLAGSSPALDGSCAAWSLRIVATGLFAYQTLDGSDGKQARRTKSGSPVGEIFDHGVDSICTGVYWCLGTELLCLGSNSMEFALFGVVIRSCFFCSNLCLLHTGRQSYQHVDAQEASTVAYVVAFICSFWGTAAYFMPESHRRLVYTATTVYMVLNSGSNVAHAWRSVRDRSAQGQCQDPDLVGRSLTQLMTQCASIAIHGVLSVGAHVGLVAEGAGAWQRLVYVAATTISFGHMTTQLLCTRVAQMPFPPVHWSSSIAGLAAYALSCNVSTVAELSAPSVADVATGVRCLVAGVVARSFLCYATTMATAMCDALGIRLFSITPASPK